MQVFETLEILGLLEYSNHLLDVILPQPIQLCFLLSARQQATHRMHQKLDRLFPCDLTARVHLENVFLCSARRVVSFASLDSTAGRCDALEIAQGQLLKAAWVPSHRLPRVSRHERASRDVRRAGAARVYFDDREPARDDRLPLVVHELEMPLDLLDKVPDVVAPLRVLEGDGIVGPGYWFGPDDEGV